jgi:hypothetical protein
MLQAAATHPTALGCSRAQHKAALSAWDGCQCADCVAAVVLPAAPPSLLLSQISSAAIEMQRGERASLLLRIRSIDPRRPCVKDHATLTLKADSVGQKYEWIARMNRAHGGAAAAAPAPPPAAVAPQPQPQAAGQPPAGSAATSAAPTPRTSQGGGPPALGPGAPGTSISTDGERSMHRELSCAAAVCVQLWWQLLRRLQRCMQVSCCTAPYRQ